MSRWKALAVAATIPRAEYESRLVDCLDAFACFAELLDEHMPRHGNDATGLVPHPDALAEALEGVLAELKEAKEEASILPGVETDRDQAWEDCKEKDAEIESLERQRDIAEARVAELEAAKPPATAGEANARITALTAENVRLRDRIGELQHANDAVEEAIRALRVRASTAEAQIAPLQNLRDALRACLDVTPQAPEPPKGKKGKKR